jgi:hypothetical protein
MTVTKPMSQWLVARHLVLQAEAKGITEESWRQITNGEIEVVEQTKPKDTCKKCGSKKSFFFAKITPEGEVDPKIVGCGTCQEFITVYHHERTHRNTPIHEYQVKQGITSYHLPPCRKCGYRGLVTLEHKTQEQVDALREHDCRGQRKG